MESEKMYGDKGEIPEGEFLIPIGKANVRRAGTDCTIVSFGKILKTVHEAADELAKEGIEAEVIDLRTIRPLDLDTIVESVKKTGRLVIVEESFRWLPSLLRSATASSVTLSITSTRPSAVCANRIRRSHFPPP
jgi:pyruvate/2-oxoglutarate/acetoin dehydrogenase E1 component